MPKDIIELSDNISEKYGGAPVYIPYLRRRKITVKFGRPMFPPWNGTPDQITNMLEKSVSELSSGT